ADAGHSTTVKVSPGADVEKTTRLFELLDEVGRTARASERAIKLLEIVPLIENPSVDVRGATQLRLDSDQRSQGRVITGPASVADVVNGLQSIAAQSDVPERIIKRALDQRLTADAALASVTGKPNGEGHYASSPSIPVAAPARGPSGRQPTVN
ncbi:MAG: hypothetical protein AB7H77_12210, partial [Bdellovibrionales bacterium]